METASGMKPSGAQASEGPASRRTLGCMDLLSQVIGQEDRCGRHKRRHAPSHIGPSAGEGLTAVFAMGTGAPVERLPRRGHSRTPHTEKARCDAFTSGLQEYSSSARGSALHVAGRSSAKAACYERRVRRWFSWASCLTRGSTGVAFQPRCVGLRPAARVPRRVIPQRQSKGPMRACRIGPRKILPAVTYSPTQLPMQYHRR